MSDQHSDAPLRYEVVVIGSGFGGGTVALRLAQAGKKVLVLERGRRWRGKNLIPQDGDPAATPFPQIGESHFFWGSQIWHPSRERLGLFELRQMLNLQGVAAAGVGGGSLVWGNVAIEAPENIFRTGWPGDITYEVLQPYYRKAEAYLLPLFVPGVPGIPGEKNRRVIRSEMFKAVAEKTGKKWQPVRAAVYFGDEAAPHANGHGHARQLGCNYCGLCSAGCPQNAKNTVDITYLAEAEALGAEVRPLTEVTHLESHNGTYRIHFRRYELDGRVAERGSISSHNVVLAAGTFGTTELLLQSKARGGLPGISKALGTRFSVNGNVLSGALRRDATDDEIAKLDTNSGPAIGSMINCGSFAIEDFANPTWTAGMIGGSNFGRVWSFLRALAGHPAGAEAMRKKAKDLLVYIGVGRDESRGRLKLNAFGSLSLEWPGGINSDPVVRELHQTMAELAHAQGREYVPNVFSIFDRPLTYHPLGGCPMADSHDSGVVDSCGRVFGYRGLYLADGSVIPTAVGRNPSFTIAAVAERIAERMLQTIVNQEAPPTPVCK